MKNTKNNEKSKASLPGFSIRTKDGCGYGEFVVCFLAFEFLQRFLGNQAQFKMIDLRLVFIVLFGSLYGLGYGIAGAAAQTVSLLLAYESQGTKWYTLFLRTS